MLLMLMTLSACTTTKISNRTCPKEIWVTGAVAQCWAECSPQDLLDFTNQQLDIEKAHGR